ncbi:unnamed protein product [Didymodactylos carnosus]|uniref:Uncharacterized protein n=1 Tax=Didymodactylos carnosus TaxID=1234261 RepID=A0A814EZ75_9BILA|nr:unnamed protein product [Didymodactylos carnosus]CAF0975859.1 unnamed protein product [Didymodactylos carnosus]CAF3637569.1 unnamed protein product [Didymodactylos carnosus]CAF3748714.1 unnamed protein product [Didymodactylos carnosus]
MAITAPFKILDSTNKANDWKAKHGRLFVLHLSIPLMIQYLSESMSTHFVPYTVAIKLLHCPRSTDEIELGELLLNRYCEQVGIIYDDESIEILSLYAHLHLAEQVRAHNGFAFTSAFALESCIRFIKKKAHRSKNLGTSKELEEVAKTMSKPLNFEINSDYQPNDISCTDHHTPSQNANSIVYATQKASTTGETLSKLFLSDSAVYNILNIANTPLHRDDDDNDNNNFLYRAKRRTLSDHQHRTDKNSSYLTNSLPFSSTSASNDNEQDGLLILQQLSSDIKKMTATQIKSLCSILKLEMSYTRQC